MTGQIGSGQIGSVNGSGTDEFDLRWMINAILYRRWTIVAVPLICMVLASVFVIFRPSDYTATTQLQLTNLRLTFIREDAFFAETHPDPSFLETQLQIMRSDRVATDVLNSLEMVPPDASAAERAKALEDLRRSFSVDRAGLSNVVQISYTAHDPQTAARIANEFARAYVTEQNSARLDAAKAGSSWLRERLREVGPKSRVIAEALPPQHKSNLRGIYIIAGAGAFGGLLAVAGAIFWRALDRRIVTPEAASASTGVPCLGIIPRISAEPAQPVTLSQPATVAVGKKDLSAKSKGKQLYHEGEADTAKFTINSGLATYAVDHPGSELSRTLRNIQAASQDCFGGKGLRSIAVTSTYAGEGRSTVAANFALWLAASGRNVLLIDSDASDPALSIRFSDGKRPGLIDYLEKDEAQLSTYLLIEERTGLRFLPIGGPGVRNGGMIWTKRLERLLAETLAYDYVIFDVPTLSDLGDIRASARYLDAFVLVIGWNKVSSGGIQVGLDLAGSVSERLLGTILNNVKAKSARWMLSPQTAFVRRQRI